MGWAELGYNQGAKGPRAHTPNLDAMANGTNTIVFYLFYAGAPVCSPTRTSVRAQGGCQTPSSYSALTSGIEMLNALLDSKRNDCSSFGVGVGQVLTGRTPNRDCVWDAYINNISHKNKDTLAQVARRGGYATAHFGLSTAP